uniref:Oxidored_FMN domain-containing protein n=1 Tax=Steinernema glaseri TaxID=37863 RepID=A0A1I7YP71_9BILA
MVVRRLKSIPTPNAAEILGQALHFPTSGRVAANRFLKAALTERTSSWDPENPQKCGIPHQGLFNLYEKWSHGGFGMILTGNVLVCPKHLESAGNAIIHESIENPERREAFKKWAETMKASGSLAVAQLSHAGRVTPFAVNSTPFSASDVQLGGVRRGSAFGKPIPLTQEQIKENVIKNFVYAAKYCYEAGFDGVQLHAAHGYLLAQFCSPTTNLRTDDYGGSIENRSRIIFEIYEAIRKEIPAETKFIVGIKMNSVEFQAKGMTNDDACMIARRLEEAGFDFVELSGGTIEKLAFAHMRDSTREREAFFLEFSGEVKKQLKKTVLYLTGGFRTAYHMVRAVRDGFTDGIGLGRPITAEPDLPLKILTGEAEGAIDSLLNQDDFGITSLASNTQMYQAGLTKVDKNALCDGIMDLCDEQVVENYKQAAAAYVQQITELSSSGVASHGVLEL